MPWDSRVFTRGRMSISGVYRLYSEDEERKPQTYGPLTYVIAGFAILVTLLFLGSLFIL